MLSYGEGGGTSTREQRGFNKIWDHLSSRDASTMELGVSIYTTIALALLNLLGYFVLVVFLGATQVPMLIQEIDVSSAMQQKQQVAN